MKKIDLIVIKAQLTESLRLKKNQSQCNVALYSKEVELLIDILNNLIEKQSA